LLIQISVTIQEYDVGLQLLNYGFYLLHEFVGIEVEIKPKSARSKALGYSKFVVFGAYIDIFASREVFYWHN